MSGEAEMTRQLSIVTGCSAGATESFVVVPFELVKIKYISFPFARRFSQTW
jgi:solute carrier family 25 2-oxodicarboxylate transporter 21